MILKKRDVKWMIAAYLVVCGIIAWSLYKRFSASELNSFVGSLVGGALGGLGTLLTLHFTVGSTYDIIAESRRSERKKFVDATAQSVAEYFSYLDSHYSTLLNLRQLKIRIKETKQKLSDIDKEICALDTALEQCNKDDANAILSLSFSKDKCTTERNREIEIYKTEENEVHYLLDRDCSTKLNAIYYMLHNQLAGISCAKALIDRIEFLHNATDQYKKENITAKELNSFMTRQAGELQHIFVRFSDDYMRK